VSRFMEILKNVGEAVSQVAPGLNVEKILFDVGKEGERLLTQGRAEAASLLYQGHGYVPYGPGQNQTAAERALEPEPAIESPEHSLGRSM
jgi:hypothetical protein